MNQSNTELKQFYSDALKWACRVVFLLLVILIAYVATRESYNFSHWVPHHFLRDIGVPYDAVLWSERNADIFLHFFGGMILTLLIFGARLSFLTPYPFAIFVAVSILCLTAEVFQSSIGRGAESSDLLLGILGSFMAYLAIDKKN